MPRFGWISGRTEPITIDFDIVDTTARTDASGGRVTAAFGIEGMRDSPAFDAEHFGAVAINKIGWDSTLADMTELGLGFLRFPGGTLAESAVVRDGVAQFQTGGLGLSDLVGGRDHIAYDITHPEVIAPAILARDEADGGRNDVAGLSELFAEAIARDTDVSIVLPVGRYYGGIDVTDPSALADARSAALSDLDLFLDRLEGGEFNGGDLPGRILFEIGNEEYGSPIEYALMARLFTDMIAERQAHIGAEVEVAVQMGTGSTQFRRLDDAGYFDRFWAADGTPRLTELDGFDPPARSLTYTDRIDFVDRMMVHVMGDSLAGVGAVRHHYLGMTTGMLEETGAVVRERGAIHDLWRDAVVAAGGVAPEYFVSEWSVASGAEQSGALTLSGAGHVLELFAAFAELGVDRASVWGLNGARDFFPAAGLETVWSFADNAMMSPQGEVLRLLSECIRGKHLLGQAEVSLDAEVTTTVFADDREIAVFLRAGDIRDAGMEVDLDLGDLGRFRSVTIDRVMTESGTGRGAAVSTQETAPMKAGTLSIAFEEDYEIVRLLLQVRDRLPETRRGTGADDVLGGSSASDRMMAAAGDDVLRARGGDDRLFGGAGEDRMTGGAGSDVLVGGAGRDVMRGGGGADRFVFRAEDATGGHSVDRVLGFGRGDDVLDLRGWDLDAYLGQARFTGAGGEARLAGDRLLIDADGDRRTDAVVVLSGPGTVDWDDLML